MKRLVLGLSSFVLLAAALPVAGAASPASAQAPAESMPRSAAAAMIKRYMDFEGITSSVISPDGRLVVYGVNSTDWQANRWVDELWIAVVETGERYRLTSANKSDFSPKWSPDGKRIAFLSDREGANQIFLISPRGGEASRLTNVERGVGAFGWSPDGTRIAFTTSDPEAEAVRKRRDQYADFEVREADGSGADHVMSHLWMVEVPSTVRLAAPAAAHRLTQGEFSVSDPAWSPDGRQIAFSAVRNPLPEARHTADLFLFDLASRKLRKLVDTGGPDTFPIWSPDGSHIAYHSSNGSESFFETNVYIAIVPAAGGAPRLLTAKIDEQPTLVAWNRAGIYFQLLERTDRHLWRLDPGSGAARRVTAGSPRASRGYSFSADQRRMAFLSASDKERSELFVTELGRFRPRRLTAFADQYRGMPEPSRELVSWRSTDGTTIEGVLIKPPGFDPARKYPLLVVVHGGPQDVDRPILGFNYAYPVETFAAKGALILRPNYRGSVGYGEAFRAPEPRTLSDYEDVISGVRHLVEKGLADRGRIGVMGWSQGGYLAALLATKGSDWFKAASAGASVPNWLIYYSNGDAGYWVAQWFKAGPLKDPEVYRIKSPISYVDRARTPVLIQHGENDRRAPVAGAYEFYQALKDRGVPVKMIVYRNTGHGVGTPRGQVALQEQNYDWFSRWLWNEQSDPRAVPD